MDKQTAKLVACIVENLPDLDGTTMQGWIDDPRGLQKFLLGLCPGETPLDTIIRVDRFVRPIYPDWAREVVYPELETVGPAEYDLARVELFLHNGQKNGKTMSGSNILDFLKRTDSLKNCLSLHDALEIQKKGDINVFRRLFGGKAVLFWKSVVRDLDGDLYIPYVYDGGYEVEMGWGWLGRDWSGSYPAARFAS